MSIPSQPNKPSQVVSEPNLHKPKNITQPQTSLESGPQTKYTPALQTRSGQQARSKLTSRELPPYPESVLPPYPEPVHRALPRLSDNVQEDRKMPWDLDIDINIDIEENSPYQEGIISETYQRTFKNH